MIAEQNLPYWELSVLSRAVEFQNLSAASVHIRLSQPQLSRIIARLEELLKVKLLDRTIRRKSAWTPEAKRLAEVFSRANHGLTDEIHQLVEHSKPQRVRVGTLEGLIELSLKTCETIYRKTGVSHIELDVLDLDELESALLNGTLDLIFTSREIAKRKLRFSKLLGYQDLKRVQRAEDLEVLSHYERRSYTGNTRTFTSNSLEVRRRALEQVGGSGWLPSAELTKTAGRKREGFRAEAIHLHGAEALSEDIWRAL